MTFQEVKDLFEAADIRPEELQENGKEHSSEAGRIYAKTGGVSEAVQRTVRQLRPESKLQVMAEQADGIAACKELLAKVQTGETKANFFEGMGCPGGCVGGPKAILEKGEGRKRVEQYGAEAVYQTPLENPYVMKLMERLGFQTVDELLEEKGLFTREFERE